MVSGIHASKILGKIRSPEVLMRLIEALPAIKEKDFAIGEEEKLTPLETAISAFGNKAVRIFREKIIEDAKSINDREKELKQSLPRHIKAYLKKCEEESRGRRKEEKESVIEKISKNLEESEIFDGREAKDIIASLALDKYSPNALEALEQTLEIRLSINDITALNSILEYLKQQRLKEHAKYGPILNEIFRKHSYSDGIIKGMLFNEKDYPMLQQFIKNMELGISNPIGPLEPGLDRRFNAPVHPVDDIKAISSLPVQDSGSSPVKNVEEDEAFVAVLKQLIKIREEKNKFNRSGTRASIRRILERISTEEALELLAGLDKLS